jgi:mRNA interferase MazF
MSKDFDSWNEIKKEVDDKKINQNFFFYEREVWWCSLGANIGVETDGKNDNFERPVLLVKRFNKDMAWVLPITSRSGDGRFYYPIRYEKQAQSVIVSQIRTVSTKRLLRKIRVLPDAEFVEIINKIDAFLKQETNETPPKAGNLGGRSH